MPSKETTYAGMLGDWQRLLGYLTANAAELGHLEASRTKLDGILSAIHEVGQRQAALAASKQEASKQLKALIGDGQRVATVLRVSLRDHYGPRAEKLVEFGLQPFRRRKTKQAAPEVPESPTPDASR